MWDARWSAPNDKRGRLRYTANDMPGGDYKIKTMSRAEVDLAIAWGAAEGWNPGLEDAACFYAADPNGFFLGVLDGEPIACVSAVTYGDSFGFLGFYILQPEHRGGGYGLGIFNAAMAYLGDRNAGLDGVVAQQHNYRKSGYRFAYRNLRYEGTGRGRDGADVVAAGSIPFDELAAYDRMCFPAPRDGFLKCWIGLPDSTALAIRRETALAGYGVIRRCRRGHRIGPLFADDPAAAEALFGALCARAAGEPVFLDVPEPNGAAVELAERHGMRVIHETARMYTKGAPEIALERIFGVTTFELG